MGTPKALIEVEGRPLALRVAERVSLVAHPVFLATGTPGRYGDLGLPELEDARPGAGPLAALAAGLEASPHSLQAVVAGDMPFASAEVLRLLATLHIAEDAIVPVTEVGLEPLHAVYSRRALPAIRAALDEGMFALRLVLRRLRVREVGPEEWRAADPTGRFALNLNNPEDLARLM